MLLTINTTQLSFLSQRWFLTELTTITARMSSVLNHCPDFASWLLLTPSHWIHHKQSSLSSVAMIFLSYWNHLMLFTVLCIMKVSKSVITVLFPEMFDLTGFLYFSHNECWNSLIAFNFPSALLIYTYFDSGSCIHSLIFIPQKFPAMISVLCPQRFRWMHKSAHQAFSLGYPVDI